MSAAARRRSDATLMGMSDSDAAHDYALNQPVFGYENRTLPTPVINDLLYRSTSHLEDVQTNPLVSSVLSTNTSGLRGVMPCKGVTNQIGLMPGGSTLVFRRPPENQMQGYYPKPIPGIRHMPKGILEQPGYCPPRKLLVPADNFNAGLQSRLGLPD